MIKRRKIIWPFIWNSILAWTGCIMLASNWHDAVAYILLAESLLMTVEMAGSRAARLFNDE